MAADTTPFHGLVSTSLRATANSGPTATSSSDIGFQNSSSTRLNSTLFPVSDEFPPGDDVDYFDETEYIFYYVLYKVTVPTMFGLIILLGLTGNLLVVIVTLTRRKMWTTVNLLLLNLAASDIIFVVVCVPFMAYHYAAENWHIGDVACKLSQYILYVTVYVTVYTLVAIAVIRFVRIVRCPRRSTDGKRRRIIVIVAAVWLTMLLANSPVLSLYRVKSFETADHEPYTYCGLDSHVVNGPRLFLSFFALAYVAPLTVIATMYVLILRFLRARRRRSMIAAGNGNGGSASSRMGERRRTSYASRVFLAVVVVFGVCWLPLHVHLLVAYFGLQPGSRAYAVFRVVCHILAYSNSCVNPFIYHYVSADFRRSLHGLVGVSRCGQRPVTASTGVEIVTRGGGPAESGLLRAGAGGLGLGGGRAAGGAAGTTAGCGEDGEEDETTFGDAVRCNGTSTQDPTRTTRVEMYSLAARNRPTASP